MRADFRREHQIAWAHAEAKRLNDAFGHAATIAVDIADGALMRGDRLVTVSDPGTRGVTGALCVTSRSEEGSLWTVELFPVEGEDHHHVPPTKSIQALTLQMRYNTCVHATTDYVLGKRSGEGGLPDFVRGVTQLLRGEVALHRRWAASGGRADPYALLAG